MKRFRGKAWLRSWAVLLALGSACAGAIDAKSESTSSLPARRASLFAKGRVVHSGSRRFSEALSYDLAGRVREHTYLLEGVPYVYHFQYAYAGGATAPGEFGTLLKAQQFPDGETVETLFDAVGAPQRTLSRLTDEHNNVVYVDLLTGAQQMNRFGQLHSQQLGDGSLTLNVYGATRRLAQQVILRENDGTILQAFGYQYDKLGRITSVADYCSWQGNEPTCCDPRTQSCVSQEMSANYDFAPAGHLRSVQVNGMTQTFHVDAIGNLTLHAGKQQAYSDARHPHAITHVTSQEGQRESQYDYNPVGAMVRMQEEGVVTHLTWNAANMPQETRSGPSVSMRFYLGEQLRKRIDATPEKTQTTLFLPGLRVEQNTFRKNYGVAEREAQPSESTPEARRGRLRFFHSNHLGSNTLVTSSEGLPVHRAVYAPFGETLKQTGSFTPKLAFAGKEKEALSGLYDFGARLYHPRTGRFVSADSVMDGLNPYTYSRNDPLNFVDPSGHVSESVQDICQKPGNICDSVEIHAKRSLWQRFKDWMSRRASSSEGSTDSSHEWDPKFAGARIASTPQGGAMLSQWPGKYAPGLLPGAYGMAGGLAMAYLEGDNMYAAGAMTVLPIFRNIHLPRPNLRTSPRDPLFFIEKVLYRNRKSMGLLELSVRPSIRGVGHLNAKQQHEFALEWVEATATVRKRVPLVARTIMHPSKEATLIQEELSGLPYWRLSDEAKAAANQNIEVVITDALQAAREFNKRPDRIYNWFPTTEMNNFRFTPTGEISGWGYTLFAEVPIR